jgi:hypothetical protein
MTNSDTSSITNILFSGIPFDMLVLFFIAGILGIYSHCLVEQMKINKTATKRMSLGEYMKYNSGSIQIAFIVLILSIFGMGALSTKFDLSLYGIPIYFSLAYFGQSLLVGFLGKASDIAHNTLGIDINQQNNQENSKQN